MKMVSKRKNKRKTVIAEERSHFNLVKTGSRIFNSSRDIRLEIWDFCLYVGENPRIWYNFYFDEFVGCSDHLQTNS